MDDEERLENIAVYYRELSDGKSAGELIGCAIQGLQEMLEEYNGKLHSSGEKDYQDYYISQIESCGVFMETVKRLLGEEPDMDDSAELRQMHDNSDNSEEWRGDDGRTFIPDCHAYRRPLWGRYFSLVLKHQKPKHQSSEESAAIRTAQEFINVRDVKDKYLYTKDGLVLTFLRVHGVSIDLYSKSEKHSLIRQLTAELSDIQYPFKFMAVSARWIFPL